MHENDPFNTRIFNYQERAGGTPFGTVDISLQHDPNIVPFFELYSLQLSVNNLNFVYSINLI